MEKTKVKRIVAPERVIGIKQNVKLVVICENCGVVVGQDSGGLIDRFRIDLTSLHHIGHDLVTWSRRKNQVLKGVRCDECDFS